MTCRCKCRMLREAGPSSGTSSSAWEDPHSCSPRQAARQHNRRQRSAARPLTLGARGSPAGTRGSRAGPPPRCRPPAAAPPPPTAAPRRACAAAGAGAPGAGRPARPGPAGAAAPARGAGPWGTCDQPAQRKRVHRLGPETARLLLPGPNPLLDAHEEQVALERHMQTEVSSERHTHLSSSRTTRSSTNTPGCPSIRDGDMAIWYSCCWLGW